MREFLMTVRHTLIEKYKTVWHLWYALKSYVRSALWVVPIIAMLIEQVGVRVLRRLDDWLNWTMLGLGVPGAQAVYQTIITLSLSFLVFTFGSLLVAIQVASGQMTPRVIATTLLRDNTVRFTVGLFVVTLLLAIQGWSRTETTVHQLILFVTALLGMACIAVFLYLIDYAARLLRPGSIVAAVGNTGATVIADVYPDPVSVPDSVAPPERIQRTPDRVVYHERKSAIVLAVNIEVLADEARWSNGIIEFAPRVGDMIAVGEPLFLLYGGASRIDENKLRAAVATGPERTMEQDPMFAFRILIDIALKALSKAINDPTTAVLAIDQLHRLLRALGKRRLSGEEIRDANGQTRVIFRTPNWEDYVHLTFTELRLNGAESVQIARRLRAMVENLVQSLPAVRHAALRRELDLLDRTVETVYGLAEDRALALIPDSQGLGGSMRSNVR